MKPPDHETRLGDLEERIRNLELENESLAAHAEDLLLLGLIGEQIQEIDDRLEVVAVALERMSLLKDVPFCSCGHLEGKRLSIHDYYCSFSDSPLTERELVLEEELTSRMGEPGHILCSKPQSCVQTPLFASDPDFQPRCLLILPFSAKGHESGVFLLADDGPPETLRQSAELLHRIVDLVAARLEHLAVLEELQRLNAELDGRVERRTEELRQAQKLESVGRLAGGVAHDFNNLLSSILGFSEMARSDLGDDDPMREDLDQIIDSAERAAELTQQLLAFSRKQSLKLEPLTLAEVIGPIVKMLRRTIGEDIELEVRDRSAYRVMADRGQLEQVLLNLAVNARDAMPEGGSLLLEARDESRGAPGVALTCTDSGQGMSEEVASQVFEPFFTTKEPGKGTGLGLATSYGIILQHGGHIEVESQPGRGSTFRIFLPAAAALPVGEAETASERDLPRGEETILVVDDDEGIRALVARVLTPLGYRIREAGDGREALAQLREHGTPIDLVLSDVVMPKLDGRALAREMAELATEIPVLLMSGYPQGEEADLDLPEQVAELLAKPLSPAELAIAIRKALDRARDNRVKARIEI